MSTKLAAAVRVKFRGVLEVEAATRWTLVCGVCHFCRFRRLLWRDESVGWLASFETCCSIGRRDGCLFVICDDELVFGATEILLYLVDVNCQFCQFLLEVSFDILQVSRYLIVGP